VLLLVTGIATWPFAGRREALLRVLLAAVALPVVLALTTPVLLVGRVQMWLVELAVQHRAGFHEPSVVTFMIFMESGGRWLVPLVLAVASTALSYRLCGRSQVAEREGVRTVGLIGVASKAELPPGFSQAP